jgi:pilus assembly protein FimV
MVTPNLRLRSAVARHGLRLGAIAALLLPTWLQAYSVGEPQLLSRYAEPLRLQVPVTLAPSEQLGDAAELSIQLLPLSAYEGLGLPMPALQPQSVQIRVQGEAPLYTVDIRSSQIVREPFLTLVLEVRLGGMRVLRELPLLFDLPQPPAAVEPVLAAPAPAQPAVPEPSVVVASAAPEPVAAEVAIKPEPEPAAPPVQRAAAKPRKPPRLPSLRLDALPPAEPVAPAEAALPPSSSPLPRFQLSSSFDSYARLSAAGQRPEPATAVPDPLPTDSAPEEQQPVTTPVVVPAGPSAASDAGMLGWLLSFLAGVAVGPLVQRWRERRGQAAAQQQGDSLPQASAIEEPEAVANAVPPPEPTTSVQAASEAPLSTMAPAAMPPPVAQDSAAQEAIRRRIGELRQGNNDLNLARKLQLVEAYLDLGRAESAATLLAELESGLPKAARPAFTLIKG